MPIRKDREDLRFYRIWGDMKYRCNNPNCNKYYLYGGRGISVCERWHEYINFYNDMYTSYLTHCNEYGVKDTTLDRIDPDKNYCPENCRWATNKQQAVNIRGKSYYRAYNEDTKEEFIFENCVDFCKDFGFTRSKVIAVMDKNKKYKGFIFSKLTEEEKKTAQIKLPTKNYKIPPVDREKQIKLYSKLKVLYDELTWAEFVDKTGYQYSRSALLNQFKRYLTK